ncbi:unnamed protein product [Ixodes persulcatus]
MAYFMVPPLLSAPAGTKKKDACSTPPQWVGVGVAGIREPFVRQESGWRRPEGLPSEAAAQRHCRTATINPRDSSIGPKCAAASESDRRHTQGIEPNARHVRERYPPGYASRGSNASLESPRTVAASESPRHRDESDCQTVFDGELIRVPVCLGTPFADDHSRVGRVGKDAFPVKALLEVRRRALAGRLEVSSKFSMAP